jgi:hypothetical protein
VAYARRMSRPVRAKPRDLAPNWPDGPSLDPIAEVARVFAWNIREVIAGRSARAVAAEAEINHVTLLAILDGRVWPDLATVAKLEHHLAVDAWPGRFPSAGK